MSFFWNATLIGINDQSVQGLTAVLAGEINRKCASERQNRTNDGIRDN
jgi:hypothetical protein